MNNNFNVYRLDTSAYQKIDYKKYEMKKLELLQGVTYLDSFPTDLQSNNILITNSSSNIRSLANKDLSHIKLIIHPNSGYDNYYAEFVKDSNFPIVTGNTIRQHSVTNYILSALFAHYSPIPKVETWDYSRTWKRKLLIDQSVLLIGLGHIGSLVKKSLEPLVKKITFYDPYLNEHSLPLKDSNIVILAPTLNRENRGMINETFLQQLPDDHLLINGARGALIDHQALATYLRNNPKATAYVDVFSPEPNDYKEFTGLKNIIKTSHIAGVHAQLDEDISDFIYNLILDFQKNYPDLNTFSNKYKKLILKNKIIDGKLV